MPTNTMPLYEFQNHLAAWAETVPPITRASLGTTITPAPSAHTLWALVTLPDTNEQKIILNPDEDTLEKACDIALFKNRCIEKGNLIYQASKATKNKAFHKGDIVQVRADKKSLIYFRDVLEDTYARCKKDKLTHEGYVKSYNTNIVRRIHEMYTHYTKEYATYYLNDHTSTVPLIQRDYLHTSAKTNVTKRLLTKINKLLAGEVYYTTINTTAMQEDILEDVCSNTYRLNDLEARKYYGFPNLKEKAIAKRKLLVTINEIIGDKNNVIRLEVI